MDELDRRLNEFVEKAEAAVRQVEAAIGPQSERAIRLECLRIAAKLATSGNVDIGHALRDIALQGVGIEQVLDAARQLEEFVLGNETGATVKVQVSAGEP